MTTLLLDADSFVYAAAIHATIAVPSEETDDFWGLPLYVQQICYPSNALARITQQVSNLMEAAECDKVVYCLTDSNSNFRTLISPEYKHNRKHLEKPMGMREIREGLLSRGAVLLKNMEADDAVGILTTSTHPDAIIYSLDKDLLQVPGKHWDLKEHVVKEITEEEGNRWHMMQALCGDAVDGYAGVKGVGPVKATKWLDEHGWTWESAIALTEKQGQTPDYLLQQARLAWILRAHNLDRKTDTIKMWEFPDEL